MRKILLILSIVSMRQIQGQVWVTIPDANLASYLQSIVPNAMSGNQLNIVSPTVTTYSQTFDVYSQNIANLNGIQYFTSITNLLCGSNQLTNLPPLPNSLKHLSCEQNQLTSLPTLPNSLQDLDCSNNLLTSLPSLPNSITLLICTWNSLTSLPSLPNSLQNLQCGVNNIHCFPIFPHSINQWLEISSNPFNCLPNYIPIMGSDTVTYPLCAAGNSNGCAVANSIEQFPFAIQATIYPNPTSDQFYIETNAADKLTVDLFDVNGRHVFSKSVNNKSNINVTTLDEGIYTMTIKSVDRVTNKKLVIVR